MRSWLIPSLRRAAWAPLTVLAFYAVAAKALDAYIHYPWLDMPTHFFGGMAATYFYLVAARHALQPALSAAGAIPLLAIGQTAMTAILWEFLEYLADILFGTQMVLGSTDILRDLFFGLAGALVMLGVDGLNPGARRT